MGMIAFLPWFQIQQPEVASGIEIFPYPANQAMNLTYPAEVQLVLRNYQEKNGQPIRHASILKMASKGFTANLTKAEIDEMYRLKNAMSIAGISNRQIGQHHYVNSDTFDLIIQSYTQVPIDHISVESRMRGGTRLNGYPFFLTPYILWT